MCMNTNSVKKRSSKLSGDRKLRAIDWPKIGSRSSHSVVTTATYWASLSQTSQQPGVM
jgi:hypothetical protein